MMAEDLHNKSRLLTVQVFFAALSGQHVQIRILI
jgi:hypothetical protein